MKAFAVIAALAVALGAASAANPRIPRDPIKCTRVYFNLAHKAYGGLVEVGPSCPQLAIPARYVNIPTTVPRAFDLFLVRRQRRAQTVTFQRIATLLMPLNAVAPSPPADLTINDKRPRHFATIRFARAGAEFVSVTPRIGRFPLTDEESLQ